MNNKSNYQEYVQARRTYDTKRVGTCVTRKT